jgi:hypothetical protein
VVRFLPLLSLQDLDRYRYCAHIELTDTMVHVTLFSFLRSIVSFGSQERKREIAKIQQEDHAYARGNIESRGPCPGLNSLANQGYLCVGPVFSMLFVAILTSL